MSEISCAIEAKAGRPRAQAPDANAWAAVLALMLGVFSLVTAEFLPASLLTPMALDLGVTPGAAGQMVTATAVVAAFAGPLIVVGTGRLDRRVVVLVLTLLLIVSNVMVAMATSLPTLLLARVGLGVALGGFWSLAAALALRLVSAEQLPRAMSIIFMGVSAATVCAAPLGAWLGDVIGWRGTFMAAAGLGIATLLAQLLTLPRLPPVDAPGAGIFLVLLRRRRILVAMLTVILVISGHFAGFTYIRPFLERTPRLDVEMISLVLLAFGIAGFLGNLVSGIVAGRSARLAVGLCSLLLAASAALLLGLGGIGAMAAVGTAVWGFAFGAFPVGAQSWTTQSAPDHAESAGALLVTTFQVAIATGAIAGGLLVDGLGVMAAIGYAALTALLGGLAMLILGGERRAA